LLSANPRRRLLPVLLLAAATLATTASAPTGSALSGCSVSHGYDVFETVPGGTTLGVQALAGAIDPLFHYQGVPLGGYEFAGVGQRETGPADTIVARLADATPQTPVVPVQLVALQLASLETVGGQQHFITLQSARTLADVSGAQVALAPGSPSVGTLTLAFDGDCSGGTLDSLFAVNFDVRLGSLTGPIIASGTETISATAIPWSHLANQPRELTEQGRIAAHRVRDALLHLLDVDYLLNHIDESTDFHPGFALGIPCGASTLSGPTGSFPPPASSGATYGGPTRITLTLGTGRTLTFESVWQVSGPTAFTSINHADNGADHHWEFHGGDFNTRGFRYHFHTVCNAFPYLGPDEDFAGGPVTVYN
jgi:hypothetical protein